MLKKINKASDFIQNRLTSGSLPLPAFGMVLGSGQGAFADQLDKRMVIPFEEIPHFPVSTVAGHTGQIVAGLLEDIPMMILQGRFHYYEGYSMGQVAFPCRCMLKLNIPNLIVTNAAGSVDPDYRPGDLMLIKDHIKFHADSPLRGPNMDDFGPRFNDMSDPYTGAVRKLAMACATEMGIKLKQGVYYYMTGPSYETTAEVRAIRILGGNAVGMSTVPEVIVAAHGGMNIMGLSCITNMATGTTDQTVGHDDVIKTSERVSKTFVAFLNAVVRKWASRSDLVN
jgi:purine-nucleoside phosphorylase